MLIAVGWTTTGSAGQEALAEIGLALGVSLLILWLIRPRTQETRPVRTLAWFGLVASYPFYLWHRTVMEQVRPFDLPGPVTWIGVLLIATAIGVLSYRIVERPTMRLASRLAQRPDPVVAVRGWATTRMRGTRPASAAPASAPIDA